MLGHTTTLPLSAWDRETVRAVALAYRGKGVFSIEGPMSDDNPWNQEVLAAQEKGRDVVCFSSAETVRAPHRASLRNSAMAPWV